MTASVRRRNSFEPLVAVGAVALLALLALLAFATLLVGEASDDHHVTKSVGIESALVAAGGHEHDTSLAVTTIHEQLSTHFRGVTLAVLVAVAVGVPTLSRRLRLLRADRPGTSPMAGLPPGRAPPARRVA